MSVLARSRGDSPHITFVAKLFDRILACVAIATWLDPSAIGLTFRERPLAKGNNLAAVGGRFLDSLIVKIILGRFGQQKDVLMALGAAVSHRLWHRIWLGPDDVLP